MNKTNTPKEVSIKKSVTSGAGAVNFFLKSGIPGLTNLKVNKLLYISHGLILANLHIPLLNKKYHEDVEAWKLGPVVPSVYHELKCFGKEIITVNDPSFESCLSEETEIDGIVRVIPEIKDDKVSKVLEWVKDTFGKYSAQALVELTHERNTPWSQVYEEGTSGAKIDDELTKEFYTRYYKWLLKKRDKRGIEFS
jgi:uncharacterized phage-associated protein